MCSFSRLIFSVVLLIAITPLESVGIEQGSNHKLCRAHAVVSFSIRFFDYEGRPIDGVKFHYLHESGTEGSGTCYMFTTKRELLEFPICRNAPQELAGNFLIRMTKEGFVDIDKSVSVEREDECHIRNRTLTILMERK